MSIEPFRYENLGITTGVELQKDELPTGEAQGFILFKGVPSNEIPGFVDGDQWFKILYKKFEEINDGNQLATAKTELDGSAPINLKDQRVITFVSNYIMAKIKGVNPINVDPTTGVISADGTTQIPRIAGGKSRRSMYKSKRNKSNKRRR